VCPRGDRDLRGTAKTLAPKETAGRSKIARLFDLLCAAALFLTAIAASMVIPKTYTGRIWIFGTDLALLFVAMFNLLRIQNGYTMHGMKMFCIIGNIAMLAFFVALMASIGLARVLINAPIPLIAVLLFIETSFSLGKNA
jgi:hypothetical protein